MIAHKTRPADRIKASDILVKIDKTVYTGWTSFKINCALDALADEFAFVLKEPNRPAGRAISAGQSISIHFGDTPMLKGYINTCRRYLGSEGRSVHIAGRSLAGDAIDSMAPTLPLVIRNAKIADLIRDLIAPLPDVQFEDGAEAGGFVVPVFHRYPQDTIGDSLQCLARQFGFWLVSDGDGRLRILEAPKPGMPADGSLSEQDGVLAITETKNHTQRFHRYIIRTGDAILKNKDPNEIVGKDPAIRPHRQTIISSTDGVHGVHFLHVVPKMRLASSEQWRVTLGGLRRGWRPGAVINFTSPNLGIKNNRFALMDIQWHQDQQTAQTQLTLAPESSLDLRNPIETRKAS